MTEAEVYRGRGQIEASWRESTCRARARHVQRVASGYQVLGMRWREGVYPGTGTPPYLTSPAGSVMYWVILDPASASGLGLDQY